MDARSLLLAIVVIAGCVQTQTPQAPTLSLPGGQPLEPGTLELNWTPAYPRAGQQVSFEALVDEGDVVWSIGGAIVAGRATQAVFHTPGEHVVTASWVIDDLLVDRAQARVLVLNAALADAPANLTAGAFSAPIQELHDALQTGRATVEATKVAFLAPGSGPATQAFELEMAPSDMLRDTWFQVDGVPVVAPLVAGYEGHVAGAPDQLARLVLAPEWAMGYVRIGDVPYMVRIGMDGNFPAGIEVPFSRIAPLGPFDPDGGLHPHDCLSAVPTHAQPVVEVTRSQMDAIEVDIILDADAEFLAIFGVHAFQLMVAYLAEVDAIYDHEVGIRFHILGVHLSTDAGKYPKPEDAAPLGAMASYWDDRHLERDSVHLYTGHPSSYAQANCIGGAGIPELAYTFTTVQWASYQGSAALRHTQTYAHELGHIYNAHHHYASVEGELQTIMAQGANKYAPVFSTLTKTIIRGWAEDHTQG